MSKKGRTDSGIEVHSGYLNVVLFESTPERILDVALESRRRVDKLGKLRELDRELPWFPRDIAGPAEATARKDGRKFYRPRVYILSGTFDVATVFFSPEIELASWSHRDELRESGQDANLSLLPTKASLGLKSKLPDFNHEFREEYLKRGQSSTRGDHDFVAITKLKLNAAHWPKRESQATDEKGRFPEIFKAVWKTIESWRENTEVVGRPRPLVAFGLTFGWSECLVVAHADSPGKLLQLSVNLRSLTLSVDPFLLKIKDKSKEWTSHIFATTISSVGYDYAIREKAKERIIADLDDGKQITADSIVNSFMREVAGEIRPLEKGEVEDSFYLLGCHVYPGHELRVVRLLSEIDDTLGSEKTTGMVTVDSGKRDLLSSRFLIGPGRLSPREAVALVELLHIWIRFGGGSSASSQDAEERIPHAFDFHTRTGYSAARNGTSTLKDYNEDVHIRGTPAAYFMIGRPALAARLELSSAPKTSLATLRESMRSVQIPYYLAEQVLNLISTFHWVHNREVIWDESAELIPVILALSENILAHARWWNSGKPRVFSEPWVQSSEAERRKILVDRVRRRLRGYVDRELPELLSSFRAYFYNRHLSSYLTDEMPDTNLRFRGSLHQLLSVGNLILDTFADTVLGPRACMANIGDSASPEVERLCDITVVRLNTHTFNIPILLESLAHEVGHQFLRELVKDSVDSKWRAHPWNSWFDDHCEDVPRKKNFRRLKNSVMELNHTIFDSSLDSEAPDAVAFIESASDFIETRLLAYTDLGTWVVSFLLRTALASLPDDYDPDKERSLNHEDVPYMGNDLVVSAIQRAVLTVIADQLQRQTREEDGELLAPDLEDFREKLIRVDLEKIRQTIERACIIGKAGEAATIVCDAALWRDFLRYKVFYRRPWFANQAALNLAAETFYTLHRHVSWRPPDDFRSPGRFLPCVQDAFSELRKVLLANYLPSLHVRFWLSNKEKAQFRSSGSLASGREPWVPLLQPMTVLKTRHKIIYKSIIFQRGNILPCGDYVKVWSDANSTFLVRAIQMIPAWRLSILEQANAMAGICGKRDEETEASTKT